MNKFLTNLGSRKFIISLISIISGVLTLLNCDDSLIQFICGLLIIIIPGVTYIVTEGVLDYASIGIMLEDVAEIINKYIEDKKKEEQEQKEIEDIEDTKEEIIEEQEIISAKKLLER